MQSVGFGRIVQCTHAIEQPHLPKEYHVVHHEREVVVQFETFTLLRFISLDDSEDLVDSAVFFVPTQGFALSKPQFQAIVVLFKLSRRISVQDV